MLIFLKGKVLVMRDYEINKQTLAIISCGKEKSKIIEEDNEFFVNLPATKIIDDSCKFFGSSYEGRLNGTKSILGVSHKAPIIIEETQSMIFFPTASPRFSKCAWIALNHVKNHIRFEEKSILYFQCGKNVELDISYGSLENQILNG